jgi:hypothetical protein
MFTMAHQPLCSASPANAGKLQGSTRPHVEHALEFAIDINRLRAGSENRVEAVRRVERLFPL